MVGPAQDAWVGGLMGALYFYESSNDPGGR